MQGNRLITRHELLAQMLPLVAPAPVRRIPLAESVGLASADTLLAASSLPVTSVALKRGIAIAAEDTLGATSHEPAFLSAAWRAVQPGEALPAFADAIADPALIDRATGEAFAAIAPGDGVRFAGHDLEAGRVIISAGRRISAAHVAVLAASSLEAVEVRAPCVRFEGFEPWVEGLLGRLAKAAGCRVGQDASADFIVEAATLPEPVLAITPGGFTALLVAAGRTVLKLSPRFDSALAGFLMIGLPVIATLSHAHLRSEMRPLASDIRGRSGSCTLALLESRQTGLAPCLVGDVTLDALIEATHFAILPPHIEGYASGTLLPATAFDQPLIL